ncbi:type I polyketide synthase [Streptomyces nymphaeiformis]|uniref:6-methylsalicylic acid synthase n=1 Tax=Streptomyces nymphaeiformis TaxID=2663842 RepID=A0A7W7XEU2_9ACTN|nr:type I polyketide synthase [Streptomyces nymphaeiformis]MBB4984811.1 6-methylsalicylic acid synthase [Streptomyces nymphaeiformis]
MPSTPASPEREPIAVIGIACRLPGGIDSPEQLWERLSNGEPVVGDLPADRWAEAVARGGAAARRVLADTPSRGAYRDDIAGFDAGFFGIPADEAAMMDPQHRMALEVAWEALEHAGVPARGLAGSDTGVYVGIGADDYGRRVLEDLPGIQAWSGIGASPCGAANRISHALDLRGPSAVIDTACSSSLVAVHTACQALRARECRIALAGGVMLMAGPGLAVTLARAGATSPDGRSKPFDAAADGYGRGEGCVVAVLKTLSDARRDGDRVLAVIRGSAVGQDGRTPGIMAPSARAQEAVLRAACRAAGIAPGDLDYVEAHGTGTRAGDPVEAAALAAAYGVVREAGDPLLIGSVKGLIGHLEAASGAAGLLTCVLALGHGRLPATPGVTGPSPAIPWADAGLRLVTEERPWPARGPRRLAGVSSYGYGGTLAHLILEQPPAPSGRAADRPARGLFPLSGASAGHLRANAERLAGHAAAHPELALADVGRTLAVHRSPLAHRAAVTADTFDELSVALRDLAREDEQELPAARPLGDAVWVFSGHGAQWPGMGRTLLAEEPAFAAVLDRLDDVFRTEAGFSPREALDAADLGDTGRVQALTVAVQLGLAAVWRSYGFRPAAVIGHSVGEIAAAAVAGVLDEADAARLACRRAALVRRAAGDGAMALVPLSFQDAERRLATEGVTDVWAAIDASPTSCVLSGRADALARLTAAWAGQGTSTRPVASDTAFHTPLLDPLTAPLETACADLTIRPPRLPLYTTALARPRDDAPRDGAYWATNLRAPVRLRAAVEAAWQDGHHAFVEVSTHPVVAHSVAETLSGAHTPGRPGPVVAHTLRRDSRERAALLANAAALYGAGVELDWTAHHGEGGLIDLPATAWQQTRHWAAPSETGGSSGAGHDPAGHTLLGEHTTGPGPDPLHLWQTRLDMAGRPYPGDHPVAGTEVVPAAVLVHTLARAAALAGGGAESGCLTRVRLAVPVAAGVPRDVQVVLRSDALRLSSRLAARETREPREPREPRGNGAETGAWLTHTTALTTPCAHDALPPLTGPGPEAVLEDPSLVTDRLAELDVPSMGFVWTVKELVRTEESAYAVVTAPTGRPRTWAALLDAAFSTASVCLPGAPRLRMPAALTTLCLADSGEAPEEAVLVIRLRSGTDDTVDLDLVGPEGRTRIRMRGLRYASPAPDPATTGGTVFATARRPLPPQPDARPPRRVVVIGSEPGFARALGAEHLHGPDGLRTAPGDVVLVAPPHGDGGLGPDRAALEHVRLLARTATVLAANSAPAALWVVTRGAGTADDVRAVAQGALWGLGRALAGELPHLYRGVIDLPATPGPDDLAALTGLLGRTGTEDVVSVEAGAAWAGRLVPAPPVQDGGPRCRPDATYLVTGGLGALGLRTAAWLAGRGARRLVLLGRTGLPPRRDWDGLPPGAEAERVAAVRSLERAGVTVRVVAADVCDGEALRRALDPDALGLPPVRGVVHAAGVTAGGFLPDADAPVWEHVLRAKTSGALALHGLFPPGSVDFFVLYSSAGQLLHLPGQGPYAAANAFLDGLARHRRAGGHRDTLALAWTSWRGLGMAAEADTVTAELRARGTDALDAEEALEAWGGADAGRHGELAVFRLTDPGPGEDPNPLMAPPLLRELRARTAHTAGPAREAAPDPVWRKLPAQRRYDVLLQEVRGAAARVLGSEPAGIAAHHALSDLGLDSLRTVAFRTDLERRLAVPLPPTLLWSRPAAADIATYLTELAEPAEQTEPTATTPLA